MAEELETIDLKVDFHDTKNCDVEYITNKDEFDVEKFKKDLVESWIDLSKRLETMARHPILNRYQKIFYKTQTYERYHGYLRWIYLEPRRIYDQNVENSKYPFKLWLNPNDQDIYKIGYYTVEEIEQWFNGTGPVIENGKFVQNYKAMEIITKDGKAYPLNYYAICKCGYIHHDGNRSGRKEMTDRYTLCSHDKGKSPISKCPKCGKDICEMVFSDDNPEHYRNKKEEKVHTKAPKVSIIESNRETKYRIGGIKTTMANHVKMGRLENVDIVWYMDTKYYHEDFISDKAIKAVE